MPAASASGSFGSKISVPALGSEVTPLSLYWGPWVPRGSGPPATPLWPCGCQRAWSSVPTWGSPLYVIRVNKDPRENTLEAFHVRNKIQPLFRKWFSNCVPRNPGFLPRVSERGGGRTPGCLPLRLPSTPTRAPGWSRPALFSGFLRTFVLERVPPCTEGLKPSGGLPLRPKAHRTKASRAKAGTVPWGGLRT